MLQQSLQLTISLATTLVARQTASTATPVGQRHLVINDEDELLAFHLTIANVADRARAPLYDPRFMGQTRRGARFYPSGDDTVDGLRGKNGFIFIKPHLFRV